MEWHLARPWTRRRPTRFPEADLVRPPKAGSRDALEQLIMRHERRIFALAYRLTGSMVDAQDATQETFVRLHLRHPRDRVRYAAPDHGSGP